MLFGRGITNMRALVVIGNYGTKQLRYLYRVVDTIKAWKCRTDIIICTDIPLGIVGVQEKIMTCPPLEILNKAKEEVFNQTDRYDLYVLVENDVKITWHNIECWLACREKVRLPYIVGFFQYEKKDNSVWFKSHHPPYSWDESSVKKINRYTLCHHTNLHQGCFVLDQELLDYVKSHPHPDPWTGGNQGTYEKFNPRQLYGPLERSNTDIYRTPGLIKVIPISHLMEFMIWHMPNKYVGGVFGVYSEEMGHILTDLIKNRVK